MIRIGSVTVICLCLLMWGEFHPRDLEGPRTENGLAESILG